MPKSMILTFAGNRDGSRRLTTSTPNASSPRKMLPMPATRIFGAPTSAARRRGSPFHELDFFRDEKEAMAGLARETEIASGILVDHDGDVHLVLVVLLDGLDGGDLAREKQVHGVAAALRGCNRTRSPTAMSTPLCCSDMSGALSSRRLNSHSFIATTPQPAGVRAGRRAASSCVRPTGPRFDPAAPARADRSGAPRPSPHPSS